MKALTVAFLLFLLVSFSSASPILNFQSHITTTTTTIPKGINFQPPTDTNGTIANRSYTNPNVTIDSTYLDTFVFNLSSWNNPSFYTLTSNQSVLASIQHTSGSAPHTLSVVRPNASGQFNGHTYWGYVGPQGVGTIDLRYSEDLINWSTKASNPILHVNGLRWPSVTYFNNSFWMSHSLDVGGYSYIALRNSTDGINFKFVCNLTTKTTGETTENSFLYYDNLTSKYYLYYYYNHAPIKEIDVKEAATPYGLCSAMPIHVLQTYIVFAAPSVFYSDGFYWLQTEHMFNNSWTTIVFYSKSPDKNFILVGAEPILIGGKACAFPYIKGNRLYDYICHYNGSSWDLQLYLYNLSTFTNSTGQKRYDSSLASKWGFDNNSALEENSTYGVSNTPPGDNFEMTGLIIWIVVLAVIALVMYLLVFKRSLRG